uniref:Uncharacterized protein n=1 Tax=Salix viminalis TaxID=40686 RepID=A0A6N2LEN5_SALVM
MVVIFVIAASWFSRGGGGDGGRGERYGRGTTLQEAPINKCDVIIKQEQFKSFNNLKTKFSTSVPKYTSGQTNCSMKCLNQMWSQFQVMPETNVFQKFSTSVPKYTSGHTKFSTSVSKYTASRTHGNKRPHVIRDLPIGFAQDYKCLRFTSLDPATARFKKAFYYDQRLFVEGITTTSQGRFYLLLVRNPALLHVVGAMSTAPNVDHCPSNVDHCHWNYLGIPSSVLFASRWDNSGDGIDDKDKVSSRAIFISILIIVVCKVLIFSSDESFSMC